MLNYLAPSPNGCNNGGQWSNILQVLDGEGSILGMEKIVLK